MAAAASYPRNDFQAIAFIAKIAGFDGSQHHL
jgi:hypothetical protein